MTLTDLFERAKSEYGISEQLTWGEESAFCELCHPDTGKRIALLCRDSDSARSTGRCDLRCGRAQTAPYIGRPWWMHGREWAGVRIDEHTDPETVFRLLHDAVYISGNGRVPPKPVKNTVFSFGTQSSGKSAPGSAVSVSVNKDGTVSIISNGASDWVQETRNALLEQLFGEQSMFYDEEPEPEPEPDDEVPEPIFRMRQLVVSDYIYGEGYARQRGRIFCRQGEYLQDYEDNAPLPRRTMWTPLTYRDLRVPELRGYFSWRTLARKGDFREIQEPYAYMYVYELLNGIGADSPEDTLRKIEEFEEGYVGSNELHAPMLGTIRRWKFEFCILNSMPLETTKKYADSVMLKRDEALAVLKSPQKRTDEEIYAAICAFGKAHLLNSAVMKKDARMSVHFFAELWRYVIANYKVGGKRFFSACFGRQTARVWEPLYDAVYWDGWTPDYDEYDPEYNEAEYALNDSHIYYRKNGTWKEKRYQPRRFQMALFHDLFHQADRLLRQELGVRAALKTRPQEAWALPYVEAVLRKIRAEQKESEREKIEIDFSELRKIRSDARKTRDSLLTEEEISDTPLTVPGNQADNAGEAADAPQAALDDVQREILELLLSGKSVDGAVQSHHLIPAVAADAINEALFDDIGDNVLECDGNSITLVDDYIDDVREVLEGVSAV